MNESKYLVHILHEQLNLQVRKHCMNFYVHWINIKYARIFCSNINSAY